MRRISLTLSIAVLLAAGCSAFAAQPTSQAGLPPELTIADQPPLPQQLQALQALVTYARQNRPAGGGFLSGLKGMFGGGDGKAKALAVQPDLLILNASRLKGQLVTLSGLFEKLSPESAQLPFDGGAVKLSMPTGVLTEGFSQQGPDGLPVAVEGVVEAASSGAQLRVSAVRPDEVLVLLRIARIQELLNQPEAAEKSYEEAFSRAQATKSPYAAFAKTSSGRLCYEMRQEKKARNHYAMAWNPFTGVDRQGRPVHYTWMPTEDGKGWEKQGVAKAISGPLDALNKSDFWYRFMDFFVLLGGGSRWLGIVFLSIISRVIIWPLTKKQLASAEAMKRLQPQIKALQDRYVDDKQKFQEEFWRLCQQNGVNPLGGCLPMIVQMPILIFLWQGIRNYIVQFNGHGFLWVKNLAAPDMGLLVAYTISMVFFQKMTQKLQPAPMMNPQQAQQQQMMTYMMPLMFFFFFQSFPAAFLLYWLATNVVYFVQQYVYTKGVERKAASGVETIEPPKPGGTGFAGAMSRMMSLKSEPKPEESAPQPKSFHEKQAESKGKKTGKSDDTQSGKRRR